MDWKKNIEQAIDDLTARVEALEAKHAPATMICRDCTMEFQDWEGEEYDIGCPRCRSGNVEIKDAAPEGEGPGEG